MAHRDSSREQILDRAVQLASVHGLRGLTIGQLATAVEMSKGGICAHFASKEILQKAVIERASVTFAQAVIEPIRGMPDGRRRLEKLAESWFSYLEQGVFEGGCFFTNVLLELDDEPESPLLSLVRTEYLRFSELIRRLALNARERGELRADLDVEAFTWEFHSFQLAALSARGLGRAAEGIKMARAATSALMNRS